MGRLNLFELNVKKINDLPLIYEALIPGDCNFFQDVRRYQSIGPHLEIRVIGVDGRMELDPDMEPVPMNKLNNSERKALVDYLTVRAARGDNIGHAWAFFRPLDKKKPIVAFGGNVVHSDASVGKERVRQLLAYLQKEKGVSQMKQFWFPRIAVAVLILAALFAGIKYGNLMDKFPFSFKRLTGSSTSSGPEMEFYASVFPMVSEWMADDTSENYSIAEDLLRPEYISGMLATMDLDAYRAADAKDRNQGSRLVLFAYFNYNKQVNSVISRHQAVLAGTEFMRLARIYSTDRSGYASNIFYFKVGDLDIRPAEISKYMKQNMISYRDFKKIRDENAFAALMESDNISYKMKGFLENVYTFTPLRIETPVKGNQWYLLTQKDQSGNLEFAAFFNADKATLLPKRMGSLLLGRKKLDKSLTWYGLDEGQATKLKLSDDALTYFTRTTGHARQLEIVREKIKSLGLNALKGGQISVAVHRELLMGDTRGKYGIQTHDPLASLVLSNLITKSSFEKEARLSLKRDPIQVNTTLVQLSKEDSLSVQSLTITPGTTNIIRLFEPLDSFRATFKDGKKAVFEKASVNLFNPFTFMISKDSITFSFRDNIEDMEIDLGDAQLKIVRATDGNYQIIDAF
ncbi:MAG: hypothetical protein HUN04_12265 [Desulfobacter sp.]|nr:MAG: hypothetical protein HUN04_12265 [Desulfobacter sp.]